VPQVTLTPLAAGGEVGQFLSGKQHSLYLPNGAYDLTDPVRLEGWDDGWIVGGGRGDYGTRVQFAPLTNLLLHNCGRVTLCNLQIITHPGAVGAGIVISGDVPCDIRLLNCVIEVSNAQPGAALAMRAPGKLLLQGCQVRGGNPGLLVDNPNAQVTILGGDCQKETVHLRQRAGWVQAYGVGFQDASGGADVELDGKTPQPCVIAGCRTEGPGYLLRTADTPDKIDAVVKACSDPGGAAQPFIHYGAGGTLVALGNNANGGIEAGASTGTIWSLGNSFGAGPQTRNPYEIGKAAKLNSAGDLWYMLKPDEKFHEPAGGSLDAAAMKQWGYPLPPGLAFLAPGAGLPEIAAPATPLWVERPEISNIADLIPSVKKWGAVGDGMTDDTAALQKALDENRHGPLYFPASLYKLSRALLLDHRNGGWFVGAGRNRSVLIDTAAGGAMRTDGCGYATFQDLDFAAPADSPEPAFDLSWEGTSAPPADFLGAGLQGNSFYRCRFEGGVAGLSLGREDNGGAESLLVDCNFSGSHVGLAARNDNAVSNNAVGCTFFHNDINMDQSEGSFNALECRFQQAQQQDVRLRNSAGDAFYWANCDFTGSKPILGTGDTGAVINALFDNCTYTGPKQAVTTYGAGGSVIWLGGDLGAGSLGGGGGISASSFLVVGAQATEEEPFAVGGRGLRWKLINDKR
jgi:hypothetical protein